MEKNSAKISLGTAVCMFIILLLIIALAIVYYLGFINNSGEFANSNVAGDTEVIQNVNENINNSDVSEEINNTISNDEIKRTLQNYLDLVGIREGSPLGMLVKLGLCNYSDYDNANRTDDNYVKTNIKYSDYKEKMLEYVTEEWFNTRFKNGYKEQNGMLYYFDGGATGMEFEVKDITIKGDYSAQAYIAQVYDINLDGSKELNNVEFHIANNNGKYVISYCD